MPVTVEIRPLVEVDELLALDVVLRRVWGADTPIVGLEMGRAIAHSGGYVVGAFDRSDPTRLVGGSIGLLAHHRGRPALHSHVTGLLPEIRGTGAGRLVKLHQRAWAAERGIETITWTFDPLVRRNAWFNIAVLGARVEGYLTSFYGAMGDSINAGDDSDRLLAAWDVADGGHGDPLPERSAPAAAQTIDTPEDIVALRGSDPAAAARWRSDVRAAFTDAFDAGRSVVGFTRAGRYVIGSES